MRKVVVTCVLRLHVELFFFSSRRRHTRCNCDWSSDVCSSDLRPVSWFCAVVTHAMLWGCLSLLVTGGSLLGWAAFAWALGGRLVGLVGVLRLLGEHDTLRWLWLVPAKDLFNSLMWAVAFLGNQVRWSGQVLRVHRDGRMVAVGPVPAAAPAPAPVIVSELAPEGPETLHAAGG